MHRPTQVKSFLITYGNKFHASRDNCSTTSTPGSLTTHTLTPTHTQVMLATRLFILSYKTFSLV